MKRYPAAPYIVPFASFLALLGLGSVWPLTGAADQLARIVITAAVLWWFSRDVIDLRVRHWFGTIAIGALICILWIVPDLIYPAYRQLPLFHNGLVGVARSSLSEAARHDTVTLILRTFRATIIVPIVEELFWRAWMMRWIINPDDFKSVPLGAYTATSFWVVAALFASEHGPYWDVGLVAGVLFNYWMIRTKSLGDLILAHAIANLCLSIYVIMEGKWEYWL